MERRLFVLAASAFIVAAVLGSAWVTGQFTTPAVDRTEGFVSELAARDQPWTRLFRISDALSGLACLAGVALVPRVAREWPGWLALAGYALFTFLAGVFPLDCATLSNPLCGQRGTSFAHLAHTLAGVLGTVAVLAAMALLSVCWRSRVSLFFTALTLAATLVTAAAQVVGHGVGLAHRAQLTMIAVWLVYVALRLLVGEDPYEEAGPRIAPGRMGGVGGARVRTDDVPAWGGPEHAADAATAGGAPGQAAGPAAGCGRPHVVVQGTGPAVLITAGPGGAWFHWDEVAGRLAGAHRVIRFDRPGLGLSPGPPAPPTLYDEVARLAALSPAHPEQVVLIAHGVACWHAEAFARLHPMRLAKLVLVEPACPVTRRPAAFLEAAGTWLPALGGTWGATALARVAGPLTHRLLTGRPDPSGVYGMGKVLAAMAGERLARRGMADGLRRLRAEMPFPEVAVTVLGSGRGDGCARRLAAELSRELGTEPGTGGVRLLRTRRRPQLNAPEAVAGAV